MQSFVKAAVFAVMGSFVLAASAFAQQAPSASGAPALPNPADAARLGSRLIGTDLGFGRVVDQESISNPIVFAVEVENDNALNFVSLNGRYVIRGLLFDMYTQRTVTNLDEFREVNNRIDFEAIGIPVPELNPFVIGSGAKTVRVFVDPACPFCQQFYDQLSADPTLLREYRFELFVVPFLGEPSVNAALGLECHADREEAVEVLLDENTMRVAPGLLTPTLAQSCDRLPLMKRLLVSQKLSISGVPFFIAPDARFNQGLLPNLRVWLEVAG